MGLTFQLQPAAQLAYIFNKATYIQYENASIDKLLPWLVIFTKTMPCIVLAMSIDGILHSAFPYYAVCIYVYN